MELDEILKIGKHELDNFKGPTLSEKKQQAAPILEILKVGSGDQLTEEQIRSAVGGVLHHLTNLPAGSWTVPPLTGNVGGVVQRAIYKDNVALSFRLQHDGSAKLTNLLIGGYLVKDKHTATAS
jgi:hypothetical protein